MTLCTIRRSWALAGVVALAALSNASLPQTQITIDRALNSPTLTVRYSGAAASLVELRVNGESVGTRAVTTTKTNGETNFLLSQSDLKDGDNDVEVRLFDRAGKLLASEKTNISTDQTSKGPVFLSAPKIGSTVMGAQDVIVGFGQEFKDAYVSFFIDSNFRSITNYPPFEYTWDTAKESNGWHEVEAWLVDNSSTTFKTRKVRVFVNNPGGRTDRKGISNASALVTTKAPFGGSVSGAASNLRTLTTATAQIAGTHVAGKVPTHRISTVAPRTIAARLSVNSVHSLAGGAVAEVKSLGATSVISMGPKSLTPTGVRIVHTVTSPGKIQIAIRASRAIAISKLPVKGETYVHLVASPGRSVAAMANILSITHGQHIPNVGAFSILLNNKLVAFDVAPRVDGGVPMSPFRHLIEKAGGTVRWENATKSVFASANNRDIFLRIGQKMATVNEDRISLDLAPYIDRGRTIVPLSFFQDALNVTVEYDKATNHVLITSLPK